MKSKIEKVPRGIRGEKSSKDMASSRNLVSKKIKYNDCHVKLDLFVMIELWKRISAKMKKKINLYL